jgi:ankyrin repeat protein
MAAGAAPPASTADPWQFWRRDPFDAAAILMGGDEHAVAALRAALATDELLHSLAAVPLASLPPSALGAGVLALRGHLDLTALHWAVIGRRADTVRHLLDLAAGDSGGLRWINAAGGLPACTALHLAVATGQRAIASLLIARGADPAVRTAAGSSAVHLAAAGRHTVLCALLLALAENPAAAANARELSDGGSAGPTPLMCAAAGWLTWHTLLFTPSARSVSALAASPSPMSVSQERFAQACAAACAVHPSTMPRIRGTMMLLAQTYGAPLDTVDSFGRTAVHYAAACTNGESWKAIALCGGRFDGPRDLLCEASPASLADLLGRIPEAERRAVLKYPWLPTMHALPLAKRVQRQRVAMMAVIPAMLLATAIVLRYGAVLSGFGGLSSTSSGLTWAAIAAIAVGLFAVGFGVVAAVSWVRKRWPLPPAENNPLLPAFLLSSFVLGVLSYAAFVFFGDPIGAVYLGMRDALLLTISVVAVILWYTISKSSPGYAGPVVAASDRLAVLQEAKGPPGSMHVDLSGQGDEEGLDELLCVHCHVWHAPGGSVHHCKTCRRCVRGFDHHCPWLGVCIGRDNHRHFVIFTVAMALAELLFLVTMMHRLELALAAGQPFYVGAFGQFSWLAALVGWCAMNLVFHGGLGLLHMYFLARGLRTHALLSLMGGGAQ